MSKTMIAMETAPKTRRFSIEEYEAMWMHGVFAPGERVELIAGEIVEMPPIGDPHKGADATLATFFYGRLAKRATVMHHQVLALIPDSMPEPDLALLRYRPDFYRHQKNLPEDVLLLVEVSDTSLRFDRGSKLALYAAAGVPEYWILDVSAHAVEVCREPKSKSYRSRHIARAGERVAPLAFPDCQISVAEIFGLGQGE